MHKTWMVVIFVKLLHFNHRKEAFNLLVHSKCCEFDLNCYFSFHMSHVMRKPTFCKCKNKGADQLCCNCGAERHSGIGAFVFAK